MPAFRRVDGHRAGPRALGILVPPGQPTLVILRPRALEWDLLPIRFRGMNTSFCAFGRDEAAGVARQLHQALEEAVQSGECPVQIVANPGGDGFLVWLPLMDFMWLVCTRAPGRPYEPCVFASRGDAEKAMGRLLPYLAPAADAEQEYYFNTQSFAGTFSREPPASAVLRPTRSPEARG